MNLKFNFGIVLNPIGHWGGAQQRFTNLFKYLFEHYPENVYYFVSYDLYEKIKIYYPNYPFQNIIPIGIKTLQSKDIGVTTTKKKEYTIDHPGFIKQIYRFIKNYTIQKKYFDEIEQVRKDKDIKCFLGVYSGIIPLYFYLMKRRRKVSIIFCDMDSWFRDVLPKERKYWYRKYSSFNYALENSDIVDFLSPFILEGIRDRGIEVKDESVSITPCSFTDYSICKAGDKNTFQAAFAGRLEKDKNPELYLEAAIKLSNKYPEIIFHIMGEGRLSSDIKDKVKSSGLKNIIYHGFHPQPTEILADTSVFVSIQTTNNYPSQSVLEAMGCGNAIIATDVGDTRMFINQENGLLINLNADELVNAIETLYLDRELRNKLGNYAYSYVREYHTVEKMADYYVDLFKKVEAKHS